MARIGGVPLKKRLGQHVLRSPQVLARIVHAAEVKPGDHVLEIGAGPGTLTRALAEAVGETGQVAAVELDESWRPILQAVTDEHPWVKLFWADALRLDLPLGDKRWKAVANIPYYITAPLVEKLIQARHNFDLMALLVQKEVAIRLAATRGRDVGSISYFVQYHCSARVAFEVEAGAFVPPPKVDSALLLLYPRSAPPVAAPAEPLFEVIHAAFHSRRKMLRSSLRGLLGKDSTDDILARAGVSGNRRPEELTLQEFAAIANAR